jgi:hypothetical protein
MLDQTHLVSECLLSSGVPVLIKAQHEDSRAWGHRVTLQAVSDIFVWSSKVDAWDGLSVFCGLQNECFLLLFMPLPILS